jgi:hypothetical protein
MFESLHKFIRVILIFAPIVVLGWLTVKEIVPSGRAAATYDMRRETPFISKLYPKDRVSEIQEDADHEFYRALLDEPVYFDLNPSDNFLEVAVTIKYKNTGRTPFKFGGLINKDLWAFDWRDLPPTEGALQTKTEIFNFSKLVPEGKKIRFGFSAPGLETSDIEIYKIKALFVRKPLTEKEVANKILDAIIWRLNKIL